MIAYTTTRRGSDGRWRSEGRRLLLRVLGGRMKACDLAKLCDVSASTLSMLASGEHKCPTLEVAYALRRVGIDPATWLQAPQGAATDAEAIFTPMNGDEGTMTKPRTDAA